MQPETETASEHGGIGDGLMEEAEIADGLDGGPEGRGAGDVGDIERHGTVLMELFLQGGHGDCAIF